jgi:ATP synthase protein I
LTISNDKSVRKDAIKLVYWQFAIILGLALVLFLFQGMKSGLSALAGGLSYCIPTYMFVLGVFDRTGASAATSFLLKFIVGETVKLTLSAIFFVLIVKYLPVVFPAVLGGYIAAIFAFFVASFIALSHQQGGANG